MRRIGLAVVFTLGLTFAPLGAAPGAQEYKAGEVPRVGVLSPGSPPPPTSPDTDPFLEGLRALGYVEGQNVVIERRWAQGRIDRLPELAADLVRVKVDVIVTGGVAAVRAAQRATGNIPPELEQSVRGHRRPFVDHEADRELARKHRTSSAGHEAIERADGPRSYPLTRSRTAVGAWYSSSVISPLSHIILSSFRRSALRPLGGWCPARLVTPRELGSAPWVRAPAASTGLI